MLAMVRDVLLDPVKLRMHVDFYKEDARKAEARIEKELRSIDDQLRTVEQQKRRIVDVYASGDLSRDAYVRKNWELDAIVESLRTRSKELEGSAASLGKRKLIDRTIVQFCSAARAQFELCANGESVRQFLLDHLEKVELLNDRVTLHGRVPFGTIDDEGNRLPFSISSEIATKERYQDRRKMRDAAHSPSVARFIRDRTTSPRDRVASASR